MPEVASQTLDLVGRELNTTLAEARTALENYVEQPDNISLLEKCKEELHAVQGVLRVLEIYGAALLAEEMEQVAVYLLATATERKSQAESLDALMRAMVQLPSYLERVLAGGRDLALVLLPLLNDLRAVRGSSLLSEGTLLLLNLKSDKQAQPVAAAPGEPPLTVEQWARRLRSRYQVGLIGWIRGERVEQNLDILAAVAQKLEQIATRQPVFQLWWVIGAVIEALQENGLEGGVSVKRLLGLGDREIRRLYEQGEARYAQSPPVELLNNLLYYVGRAETNGPRVTAVRASFRLAELLPVDESIEQERENLSAPSVKLMQTVAAAIREDLGKVKDVLDIFVRRGAGQPKELAPQVELLRKIGDTLGVLGLGELRGKVQAETERLEKIVAGNLRADEATLVEIAATLIGVEDRLDEGLVGMILPKGGDDLPDQASEDTEFQQVQAAVLRECILNLARVKEAVAQNVGGTLDAAGLDSWQELMRGLKAGLLMLGKARAVEVIEGVTNQLKRVMQPGARSLPPGFMDRLADAIVSVEYYMETLQAGRGDPWYMLDNAQACVQALEQQHSPSVPTVGPLEPAAFARTVQIAQGAAALGDAADPTATAIGAAAPIVGAASRTQKVAALAENADPELVKLFIEEAHEELAKIQRYFPAWDQNPLERDSLVTVRRSFHTLKGSGRMVGARDLGEFAWSIENLLNRVLDNTLTRTPAILEVLREAVGALPELIEHLETGRKPRVDATAIAARAHALAAGRQPAPRAAPAAPVEQAEEEAAEPPPGASVTIAVAQPAPEPPAPASSAPVAASTLPSAPATREVATAPPESDSVRTGTYRIAPATVDISRSGTFRGLSSLSDDAGSRKAPATPAPVGPTAAATRTPQESAATNTPPPAVELPDDGKPPGLDEVLREIYARETAAHVATVRAYLEREAHAPEPHAIPEEVYRACHTLSGSSKMAQARHGIRLAEPLDHWLRRMFNSGLGLRNADLALLADCMAAMESVATHLDEPTGYFVNHWQLQERISQADKALDQRIADAAHAETHTPPSVGELPMEEDSGDWADEVGDFDPEVAAIFTEEALELIDASEHALTDWRTEPGSSEYRSALKRPLHTLKGGARMAGIMAMGDLSHELETLVMQVDNGSVAADDAVFDVVQASLDELARMRELVTNGRRVPPARAMIARIQSVSRPGGPPAAAAPAAPAPTVPSAHASLAPTASGAAPIATTGGAPGVRASTPPPPSPHVTVAQSSTASPEFAAAQASVSLPSAALPSAAQTLSAAASAAVAPLSAVPPPKPVAFPTPPVSRPVSPAGLEPDTVVAKPSAEIIQLRQGFTPPPAARSDLPAPVVTAREEDDSRADESPRTADTSRTDDTATSPVDFGARIDFDSPAQGESDIAADLGALLDSDLTSNDSTGEHTASSEAIEVSEEAWPSDMTLPEGWNLSTAEDSSAAQPESSEEQPSSGAASVESLSAFDEAAFGDLNIELTGDPAPAASEPASNTDTPVVESSMAAVWPVSDEQSWAVSEPIADDAATQEAASLAPTFSPEPSLPDGAEPLAAMADPMTAAAAMTAGAVGSVAGAMESVASATPETAAESAPAPATAPSMGAAPAASTPNSSAPSATGAGSAAATKSVSINFARTPEPRATEEGLVAPQPVPPGREPVAPTERQEMARVDADLLDQLLNISGEASIARARLEQQLGSIDFNLGELSRTVTRLKEQLRSLEIETEAQILHKHEDEGGAHRSDFDPLELDRYSSIQQYSRALAETANDVASIQQLLENLAKDTQNLLQQQARTITELQNGLMRTRMVPFQRHVQRLARIVRQAASDTGKRAELIVEGASGELDRQVLERMLPPFEHMLRNAVVHGIEKPDERLRRGKPEAGRIVLELHREGAEVMVRLVDDGGGMNLKAIREKGLALGLIQPGQQLSDEDAMQLILEPGFSTAGTITQQAGRGVGMDVVATEIKRLGGALHMETKAGEGTVFTIRLPFTLAISHALVVRTGEEYYALPLPTVEGVLRLSKPEVTAHLGRDASAFDYGGQKYRFQHLATFVGLEPSPLPEQDVTIPVVLVRAGEHSTGLVADELVGSREIVVKSVGPQISSIRGISGATILGDGRIVIILDIGELVRAEWRARAPVQVVQKDKTDKRTFAMVVDDSITVRRVTQRLLERNGMRVLTARDGMDAVTLLQDNIPDIILLDIEMPRMDGYEVAAHVRNDPRLRDVPIIMITSRVGEKHRARAIELGVDDYLGKPYQEAQLLDAIAPLVERRRAAMGGPMYAEFG